LKLKKFDVMKVYAEFIEDDGLLFRTKTLLQYGNSWDLIGSIVMKNPGSAKPGNPLSEYSKNGISDFYSKQIDFKNCTEASNNPTLKKIVSFFNGSYLQKNIKLNGIIQVFNIYNICEPKIKFVYQKAENSNTNLLFIDLKNTIKQFKNKPVYLGFFDFYTYKKTKHSDYLQSIASGIFDYVKNSNFMYLPCDDIIDNPMYHPFSPQINKRRSLPILEKFILLYEKN